jgi:hypothetical protein
MRRLPKTHKKLPMKKQDEPDFYKLDKSSPLPELEESSGAASSMTPRRPVPGMPGSMPGGGFHGMQSQMMGPGGGVGGLLPGFGFNKQGMMGGGGKDAMSNMNAMMGGGADHLRSQPSMNGASGLPPGFPGGGRQDADGMGGGGANGMPQQGGDNQIFQLQRLRHLQHLQMFQRQIGAASLAGGGSEDLARIQAEHALGLRGGLG